MEKGEPTQFYKTHIAGPPFATFMTEIFICILVFQWDTGGNGGNYFSWKLLKNMNLLWRTLF